MKYKRITIIVLDSVGIGELPDADLYGDVGSNTLGNIAAHMGGISLPCLQAMGMGRLGDFQGLSKELYPKGAYGKMQEASPGKDTTTGHWEMMGVVLDNPFPTYPKGFPPDLVEGFEKMVGRRVIGNKAASGTAIIDELGEQHMKTGSLILYTSADSVFQIAAHEEIVSLEELYAICEKAREYLVSPHNVGRVIARPFVGEPGNFTRTSHRHDYSIPPPHETALDHMVKKGIPVVGVGKISDIFDGKGISRSIRTKNNSDGMEKLTALLGEEEKGLIFVNLIDFDMNYGHRNDPGGYGQALCLFDKELVGILNKLQKEDLLIITADHGCDPTTASTDHSREYVPLLVYHKDMEGGIDLGMRKSFADIGATVMENFGLHGLIKNGESFLKDL